MLPLIALGTLKNSLQLIVGPIEYTYKMWRSIVSQQFYIFHGKRKLYIILKQCKFRIKIFTTYYCSQLTLNKIHKTQNQIRDFDNSRSHT